MAHGCIHRPECVNITLNETVDQSVSIFCSNMIFCPERTAHRTVYVSEKCAQTRYESKRQSVTCD